MRWMILAAGLAAFSLPATPAVAKQHHGYNNNKGHHATHRTYRERRLSRNDRVWRGRDGRYHCQRDNGTTGLVIGAAVGGLLGNQVAGSGDKTIGTIIGAAGGGLLGRAIDRGELKCR